MITSYVPARFTAIFAPTFNPNGSEPENISFNNENNNAFRILDGHDPRNFLLNTLEDVSRNLQQFTPRLQGLVINKTYSTVNGLPRVVYSCQFTFRNTRENVLIDDVVLEEIT